MSVSLDLVGKDSAIQRKIIGAFLAQINQHTRDVLVPALRDSVGQLLSDAVGNCNEIQSILTGKLRIELGFARPDKFVNSLLEQIKKSVKVKFKNFAYKGSSVSGGLTIGAILSDYSDLLGIPDASYESGGNDVPWLKWLLFEGGNILISDYEIEYGQFPRTRSRSGFAVMRKGAGYAMPPEFSGTIDDNFITRAILSDAVEEKIRAVVATGMGV